MRATSSAIEKYLSRYAEPEAGLLNDFPSSFKYCLCIPMYREQPDAVNYFQDFAARQAGTLLILLINRPDNDPELGWAKALLPPPGEPAWQSPNGQLILQNLNTSSGPTGSATLWVDRCLFGSPIPKEQGVGLARKIANDIACQLISTQKVQSPWIYNTDADARLPENYFQTSQAIKPEHKQTTAALLFPYQHLSADNQKPPIALQLYELSLFYYVAGLEWAGSPYAYHTLGSILCINYQHYAQVRGFPKRAGAEDFYLLNKMAKNGDIVSLKQPTITLLSRESSRVPFGTGPAVKRIIESGDYGAMPFYHPQLFHHLKLFLLLLEQLSQQTTIEAAYNTLKGSEVALLQQAAKHLKLSQAITHSFQQGKTSQVRKRHLNTWFDAFKTLKFVHYIRDNAYPMVTYREWIPLMENEPFGDNLGILKDLSL